MSGLIALLVAAATFAFGAVYPWAYFPLFAAAAGIGLAGLVRSGGVPVERRPLALAVVLLTAAVALQLVPLGRPALDALSPGAATILSRYDLAFAGGTAGHPLSINPHATLIALIGLAALGLYMLGLPSLLSQRDVRALALLLTGLGVLLALVGLYYRGRINGLVYGWWQPIEGSSANSFGPFVNRNHFAGWMVMVTCVAIGALCAAVERARHRGGRGLRGRLLWLGSPEASRIVLTSAAAMIMATALVWSMSRSGMISLACALAGFGWLVTRRTHLAGSSRALLLSALGVVLFFSLGWRGAGRVLHWFTDTTDLVSRVAAWHDGWQLARDFALTGTGLNTYGDAMLFYQKNVLETWMTHAHNDYLQLLAEGGLLVCAPAAAAAVLLGLAVRRGVSAARGDGDGYWIRAGAAIGLVAIGIQEMVEFSLQMPANALLFATLAAMAMSSSSPSASSFQPDPVRKWPTGVSRGP